MRHTSLIFIEGIMGAGKSTTAWFLTQQLQRHGIAARFLLEGPTAGEPEHPLRAKHGTPWRGLRERLWIAGQVE